MHPADDEKYATPLSVSKPDKQTGQPGQGYYYGN
jgi:hypothetical protein